jgi:hypothetical protein
MAFIGLDYALFLSAFLLLPIVIPSLLKGPLATFDEIMPGVLSDVEKASKFLCVRIPGALPVPPANDCLHLPPAPVVDPRSHPVLILCAARQQPLLVHRPWQEHRYDRAANLCGLLQ